MKIIKFDAKGKICQNPFVENEHIEPIYFQIAEKVLCKLYVALPFDSLFEGFKWENKPNEFFQAVLLTWADCFKTWGINDAKRAYKAVTKIIESSIRPTPGLFKAAYFGDIQTINSYEYEEYILYLYGISEYNDEGWKVITDGMLFDQWLIEEKRKTGDTNR